MDSLAAATSAIVPALHAGRIGTPVAVRIVDGGADARNLEARTAVLLATAQDWLASPLDRLAALGGSERGHVAALARTARGQVALVAAAASGEQPLLEVLVVGTRGVLSWEPAAGGHPVIGGPAENPREGQGLLPALRAALTASDMVTLSDDAAVTASHLSTSRGARVSASASFPPARPIVAMPPPYGVLLVTGSHTHQENYARSFAADPRCRLIGVTDADDVSPRRRALNEQLARELQVPHLDDYSAAVRRDDVQVVCVCAEPERRAALVVAAARAGKHLYLDKPLAATADEGEAIAAAILACGVVGHMFSMVRGPVAARLDRALAAVGVGDVRALHCDLFFAKGHGAAVAIERPRQESAEPREFEGIESKREFYNVGVYPLVMARRALGRRVRRVVAVTGNYFFAEHLRHDMEDFGAALCELEGGGCLSVLAGRTGWRSHPAGGVHRASIVGERGSLAIDAHRPRVEVWADEVPWFAPSRHPLDPMAFWSGTQIESGVRPKNVWLTPHEELRDDAAYFLDCVERGRASDVSADLASDVLTTQLAAYRSAAEGRFVELS